MQRFYLLISIFPQRNFLWFPWANWNRSCNFLLSYHNSRVTTWAWITHVRTKSFCWSIVHVDEVFVSSKPALIFKHLSPRVGHYNRNHIYTWPWKSPVFSTYYTCSEKHSTSLVFLADKEASSVLSSYSLTLKHTLEHFWFKQLCTSAACIQAQSADSKETVVVRH